MLLGLDERQRHIIKIASRTADAVEEGIQRLKEKYGEQFPQIFRSITCDNGSEFASLPQQIPDTPIYYVYPYSAYERDKWEAEFPRSPLFSKGKSMDGVSDEAIQRMEDWINCFPRKIFQYALSEQLFQSVLFRNNYSH